MKKAKPKALKLKTSCLERIAFFRSFGILVLIQRCLVRFFKTKSGVPESLVLNKRILIEVAFIAVYNKKKAPLLVANTATAKPWSIAKRKGVGF